jgi:hypothetical protein
MQKLQRQSFQKAKAAYSNEDRTCHLQPPVRLEDSAHVARTRRSKTQTEVATRPRLLAPPKLKSTQAGSGYHPQPSQERHLREPHPQRPPSWTNCRPTWQALD